ncbi:hypothetical protein CR205_00270 [Alteribacter lacisalsi]|uniref:Protein-glutamine gamma-glutamyltransferase-like C-terminal domain-containing protein n=1 Tax=Alteribacter lacisalsi TaxID=2045244 RepID=A0A2W0HTX9_9BACI|nr:DUF4129 domain-containing protein [Alteribacter lacisalsi]PYZ97078.1 hypothetical protein CR205_00270 [Alteribacter lacisalsi]
MEHSLARKGYGRLAFQTADEWLAPLPAPDSAKDTIARTYQKVRYGGEQVSKDERERFKQAIRHVMTEVKQKGER